MSASHVADDGVPMLPRPVNFRTELVPERVGRKTGDAAAAGPYALSGGWQRGGVKVGEREFCLTIPAVPDALLDDPAAQAASLADDRMPYWAFVWPSALPMAAAVLDTSWDPRLPVLELGCGTGLVGLAALSRGHHVTFTDYEPRAVALARYNAEQNGFTRFTAHELDWRTPMNEQYPLILGCDLLYQESAFQPLLKLLEQMLPPGGECWLGDGGRSAARWFLHHARERGIEVEIRGANGQVLENPVSDFQMFVIRRNS